MFSSFSKGNKWWWWWWIVVSTWAISLAPRVSPLPVSWSEGGGEGSDPTLSKRSDQCVVSAGWETWECNNSIWHCFFHEWNLSNGQQVKSCVNFFPFLLPLPQPYLSFRRTPFFDLSLYTALNPNPSHTWQVLTHQDREGSISATHAGECGLISRTTAGNIA